MKIDIYNTAKKYNIIYSDPPWQYKESGGGKRGTAGLPYATMSQEELFELPINDISTDETILYMWATDPKLPKAIELMEKWGFKYKGVAYVWVKTNKKSDSLFWGMGNYSRKNAEFVLLGVRKNTVKTIKPLIRNSHQIIMSKIEQHSKKPDIIRDEITKVCGDLPRIELFARQHVNGWDCWGNEV